MTLLSVIVLSYNTKDLTKKCLLSVVDNYKEDIDKSKIEIILADNGSGDGTVEEIKTDKFSRVDWVSGACLMIKKELFEKLKGFDENFFMYIEDMELCYRAKKEGFLTYFYPDIKLEHRQEGSSSRQFAIKNIYKGILYFYKKHKPYWQYYLAKALLNTKAVVVFVIGTVIGDNYLKKTYKQVLKF